MHTFEAIRTLCNYEYKYLKDNLPSLNEVSANVMRTNYYSAKGITQIELRRYSFLYNRCQTSKFYLVIRCNPAIVMGESKVFVLDLEKYSTDEIVKQIEKRLYEINEFRHIGLHKFAFKLFRANRLDVAIDIIINKPEIAVWLCNMSFPYKYHNMKRKRINKAKEILFYESCCFGSDSRDFNLYCKWAAIMNNGVVVNDDEKIRAKNTLRLEIQIKKSGIVNMARKRPTKRCIQPFLEKDFCYNYLEKEIHSVFGCENYVSRSKAIEIVNASTYKPCDKKVILSIIDMIQMVGGLYELEKAIASDKIYSPPLYGNLRTFREKWLKKIKKLGINPVVIPDDFGIEEFPSIYKLCVGNMEVERC